MRNRLLLCFASFWAIFGGFAHAQWTVVNLHPSGALASIALGASGTKQVGHAYLSGGIKHAGLWIGSASSWLDLNPPGATQSQAYAANEEFEVGYAQVNGFEHASIWSGSVDSWVDLHPQEATLSIAWGVSEANQVGFVRIDGADRASLWAGSAASRVDLNPAGSSFSYAMGASGVYQVGSAEVDGNPHASLWSGIAESWLDLNPSGAGLSVALGAWEEKQVGYANIGGVQRAGIWSGTAASWEDLHPAGAIESQASGIMGVNQVGSIRTSDFRLRASLWCGTASSWMDLHALLPARFTQSHASSITTDGEYDYITGWGSDDFTNYEALLWVRPVRFHPFSFSLFRGNLMSGGLSELLASDDQWLVAQAGLTLFAGESPLQLVVTGTSPMEEPCELRFAVEAHASTPGLVQKVYLFNYFTALYEEVGSSPASVSDSTVEVIVTSNPERFVQPGTREMKAKVAYFQVGPVLHWPWYAHFDHTYWTIRD
jgi:hypothetical protein